MDKMVPPNKTSIFRVTLTICFVAITLPGYNFQPDKRILLPQSVTKVKVENFTFWPSVKLPGSNETLFLGGAGQQFSEKVAKNCVAIWKSAEVYAPEQAKALETFLDVFKTQDFLPGSSIYWTLSTNGSLILNVSIPKVESAVINNKLLGEAFLESMIGRNGVSPATKKSLATRLPQLMKKYGREN